MTYQMANLIAGKRRTSALICQPIFDKTVDGRIFSDFLTVFRFPAGRDSRVIKQNLKARILVALTVFCAVLFRVLGRTTPYHMQFGIMRTMTYIGLYIGWGISVSNRNSTATMVLLLLGDAVYSAVFCVFSHLTR